MWKCIRCNKENQDFIENCENCGHGKAMDYIGHRSISRLRPEMVSNWKKKKEKSMLMADCIEDNEKNGTVFGSRFLRKEIIKIEFVEINCDSVPVEAWDVSDDKSKTIWAWISKTSAGCILNIGSENGVYANSNCQNLFYRYENVRAICFYDLFDTSYVTDMHGMFGDCKRLTTFAGNTFHNEKVMDMSFMFLNCEQLKNLYIIAEIKTDKVTDMRAMFQYCEKLEKLDISGFNTEQVRDMSWMFYDCKELKEVDIKGFRTSNVTNMEAMFCGCEKLENLNVRSFDTRQVTNMNFMFSDCKSLINLDTSNFCFGQDVTTENMFKNVGVNKECSTEKQGASARKIFASERYYSGDSIEEICADFLSYQKNAVFNNGWKNRNQVLHQVLEIPPDDIIYLLHDASSNFLASFVTGRPTVKNAEGFAITDKGIYTKYLYYDKSKVFIPWEMLKKAKAIDVKNNSVRIDEIAIAFNYKNSRDNSNLWELVRLFDSIRAFLKRTF